MRSIDNPSKTARASASCAPLQMLIQTCSDSMSASTIARKAGRTRSNESGKLIPSRRGQESQVAACGSHSAGMRYRSAAGVFRSASIERQRSTACPERKLGQAPIPFKVQQFARVSAQLTSAGRKTRCARFVNRTDDCANDDHFNETADAAVNDQLSRKRLDRVNAHTHADRCDLQENTKADSSDYAAAGETARINRHECEDYQRLADDDPVKQAHHFTLRPPESWRLRVDVFQQHAVKQPSPEKDKNVYCQERYDEPLHEFWNLGRRR